MSDASLFDSNPPTSQNLDSQESECLEVELIIDADCQPQWTQILAEGCKRAADAIVERTFLSVETPVTDRNVRSTTFTSIRNTQSSDYEPSGDAIEGRSAFDAACRQITSAVRAAASLADCTRGNIGVRLTNDKSIHAVNRDFLQHDYPTDVISFPYAFDPPIVEGELIVSLDTAIASCQEYGWSAREEVLLYVIHGILHLVGFDDVSETPRQAMRHAEATALRLIGLKLPISRTVASEASQTN